MSFNGITIDFPHNCIILVDMLSQPKDLLEFRFLLKAKESCTFIFNKKRV